MGKACALAIEEEKKKQGDNKNLDELVDVALNLFSLDFVFCVVLVDFEQQLAPREIVNREDRLCGPCSQPT
jgi:hypothetical protein